MAVKNNDLSELAPKYYLKIFLHGCFPKRFPTLTKFFVVPIAYGVLCEASRVRCWGSVLPCWLLSHRIVLNTGQRSIGRLMKDINVTSRHIPIGHPHARQYVIILSLYPGSTSGGISKVWRWVGCGTGKVIVVCRRADPYSSSVQVSKRKTTLQRNSFSARDSNSGHSYLILTNCMIRRKELWKKQFLVLGSLVFITGHRAWHNLRYIRSPERLWLIPHPSPPEDK